MLFNLTPWFFFSERASWRHYEEGAPAVEWGHVLESLNKLDAGVAERILLMSRDEMSMLVVSYADIKRYRGGSQQQPPLPPFVFMTGLKFVVSPLIIKRYENYFLVY